jgi:hypothetical protein
VSGTNGKIELSYQPEMHVDFGASFHTENDKPVRYASRPFLANGRHDLIFLSSYVHDAEFRMDEIQRRGKTVTLKLDRARWELERKLNELVTIPSDLTIRPVKSMWVELGAGHYFTRKFLRKPEMTIFSLMAIPATMVRDPDDDSDDEEIVIECSYRARLRLRVSNEYRILLADKPKARS